MRYSLQYALLYPDDLPPRYLLKQKDIDGVEDEETLGGDTIKTLQVTNVVALE